MATNFVRDFKSIFFVKTQPAKDEEFRSRNTIKIKVKVWTVKTILTFMMASHFTIFKQDKGQIIWKEYLVSSNSSKKWTNEFVHFLVEFEDTKSPFEIIWPLPLEDLYKSCPF